MGLLKNLFSVEMHLADMLYVSYLIPADRLTPFLPANLKPAVVDGNDNVFLTLVIFRGKTSGAGTLPAPRIPFDQVNIRTYVVDPLTKLPSVYFVHCGISGSLITFLYRILSGMPVEHTPFQISAARDRTGTYERYWVKGEWRGTFSIAAREIAPRFDVFPPFATVGEAMDYLVDPLVGFYRTRRSLKRLEVFHEPLHPRAGKLDDIDFPYLQGLGLLKPGETANPHNVLIIPFTPFLIYLPAKTFP